MKCGIVISGNERNIFLTPENEQEREALSYFAIDDDIEVVTQTGNLYDREYSPLRQSINLCEGGWLRAYAGEKSVVLRLVKKEIEDGT